MSTTTCNDERGLKPILDGFTRNMNLRAVCHSYPWLALERLEAVRRCTQYRPRWYSVPDDTNGQVIAARGSYEYQISVVPGSWLYGFSYTVPEGGYSVQITEDCSGITLFSEWILPNGYTQSQFAGIILLQPTVILEPGISVEIASLNSTPSRATSLQMLLLFAEPICAPA